MMASALFLLFSCEIDEALDLDFEPEDANINLSFTEIALPFEVVKLDSINTTNVSNLLAGNYRNPDFGLTQATAYLNMGIASKSPATADDRLDSLVLTLVNSYYYGQADAGPQELNVYRLAERVVDTLTYYSSDKLTLEPSLLGNILFSTSPDVNGSTDTLSLRLDETLGNELLDKLKQGSADLDSSALFRQYFRGLAITGASEVPFVTGFDPAGISMRMYFSAPGDTASKVFIFRPSGRIFNGLEYDRSGTPLEGLTDTEAIVPADGRFYLQSGSGILPRLNFQPLIDFVENNEDKVLLNRVVMQIDVDEAEEGMPYPSQLRAFVVEESNVDLIQVGVDGRDAPVYSGVYADEAYSFDRETQRPLKRDASVIAYDTTATAFNLKVSSFLQTIVDGYEENQAALLYPQDLRSGFSQIVTEGDRVRLRVYYTILED
ncbi:MAG: DUF4270 family protein [Cyclobacteriaceae bacterium]